MTRFFPRISRLRCPGDEQLAAYADQQLIGAERQRVESHVTQCDRCLEQVAFLVRHADIDAANAPAGLMQKAAQLRTEPAQTTIDIWKWAPVAACVVAVAVGVTIWLRPRTQQPTPASAPLVASAPASGSHDEAPLKPEQADDAVRSTVPHPSSLTILSPRSGDTVDNSDLTIRWAPLPNAVDYQLRIATADGDLMWEHKLVGTSATAPATVRLKKGTKYFVWVRAVFADGKTQQSEPVSFTAE